MHFSGGGLWGWPKGLDSHRTQKTECPFPLAGGTAKEEWSGDVVNLRGETQQVSTLRSWEETWSLMDVRESVQAIVGVSFMGQALAPVNKFYELCGL